MRAWILTLLAACILVLMTMEYREGFVNKDGKDGVTIFVSIASYRDVQCMDTLKDMFGKAKNPGRIYAGICEQNTSNATEQCVPLKFKFHDQVRKISIPNSEAKGPCYARYLCSTLYRNETYFMQIDSHTTFVKDWDIKAIQALKKCPSKKPVLSGYPHDDKEYDIDETAIPVLCDSFWNGDGLPQFKAIIKNKADIGETPMPIPFTSGGFVFAPGSLVKEVPYDPNLPHLFQGEEIVYSARAWTSGYDIFTAPVNIVLHTYHRKDEPKFWDDLSAWQADQKKSATRVRRILGLQKPALENDAYGLGTARSIEAYWTFAGLDPKTKKSTSKNKFCKVK